MYKFFIKRFFDVLISGIAIIILSPIYLIVAIMVRVAIGKPVLFKQERLGKDEKPFMMYKFRSMTNSTDKDGNLLPEAQRHTKFGEMLRSSSLDELPELWSIFIGKMSLIGPRPLPTYYGPYYYPSERKRHSIKGGLLPSDGLSQELNQTYETQFYWDCYYVDHISLWTDIKVIWYTFVIVYRRMTENYGTIDRPHLNIVRADYKQEDNNKNK